MKTSSNLPRWTGLAVFGLAAVAPVLGFTHLINPNTGLPKKWPAGPIPFRVMLGDSQVLSDGSNFNSSAQAAAEKWNAFLGSTRLQLTLAPPGTAGENNGINEMVFASTVFGRTFPVGVVGITTGSGKGNRVAETDITLNSTYPWDSYRGAPQQVVEIRRVVLHEFGHVLGLDHPADHTAVSIMGILSNNLENPQSDDIQGIQALYGPPGVPGNDAFARPVIATEIGASNWRVYTGVNTNATQEPGEPGNGGRSVWWSLKTLAAGGITIDTKGSYFDTTLGIYTGSSVSSLTSIASNDDIDPGVIQASSVTFNATAGTTYRIAVDGFNGDDVYGPDSGGLTLNIAYHLASDTAPVITAQPSGNTVTSGSNVTFSVAYTGSTPIRIQWYFNGTAVVGATNPTLSMSSVNGAHAGTYSVTVANPVASVTSTAATLTVTSPTPTPTPSPTPGSGGGGGGGGAPSLWYCALLAALTFARLREAKPSA